MADLRVWMNKLLGGLSVKNPLVGASTEHPLMDLESVLALAQAYQAVSGRLPVNQKMSQAIRQGDLSSRYLGSGMEYEESRLYESGDEIRRLNWRLMARTGKAYTKLYQEERQENWFILVDQRNSMRFGTRGYLKATQAARVAGYYAWQAQQLGVPVSLGRLAEEFEFSPTFEGRSSYVQSMQFVTHACPPLSGDKTEPSLNDVLLRLSQQLQAGSRLILISDFHDVDEHSSELLRLLQAHLMVKAVTIQDPAELVLPGIAGLQLQAMNSKHDARTFGVEKQQAYAQWAQSYFAQLHQRFAHAMVPFYVVDTTMEAESVVSNLSAPLQTEGRLSA